MNISNIGSSFAAARVASGKTFPSQERAKVSVAADKSQSTETVDMRNVSLNEINALIKSGVDGLLDILPAIPSPIYGEYADDAANVKVDFIDTIEGHIAFKKSRGEDTAFLEKVLKNVKNIDGMALPPKVDVQV